jgi:NitT/TauT family transport system permease protein
MKKEHPKPHRSQLHADYVRRIRIKEFWIVFTRIALLVLFIAGWEYCADAGWIDPFLFSSPSRITELFIQMAGAGNLFHDILVTTVETILGFALGTLGGISLATLIWASPFLSRVLDPYLVVLNSMPKVALGPLFIVAMGAGYGSVLAMGVAITIIITTLVIHTSFQSVDRNYLRLARSFGASRGQLFRKIIFPASIPDMIAALKVNVGLSWVGVIVGEFLVSKDGLGHLIIYGFQVFNLNLVLMSLLIVAVCATVMYKIVYWLEKRLLKHRMAE